LARCTFPEPGTRVECAVSGGADSMALLVLACEAGCLVTAVHVDHGLRSGSDREAETVRRAAERFGAAFRSETVEVGPGANLEARARIARYGVLGRDVMTGHTEDDQAETMLLNLMRGAGPQGMAGMRPGWRRPLLALRRTDTAALCRGLSIEIVADPSNLDPAFRRNRVRHEVLPLMAEVAQRDLVPILARQAELFASVADHLVAQGAELDVCDASMLARAPAPVASAAIRSWLRGANEHGHPPNRATVDRVLAVARLEMAATDVGAGWRVERSGGRLRLVAPGRHAGRLDRDA